MLSSGGQVLLLGPMMQESKCTTLLRINGSRLLIEYLMQIFCGHNLSGRHVLAPVQLAPKCFAVDSEFFLSNYQHT